MSGEATGQVWRHSPYRGAVLVVHLAIADVVNDIHDNEFWMAVRSLAAKARVSPSTARAALDVMVRDGILTRLTVEDRPGVPVRYRFEEHSRSPAMSFGETHSRSPIEHSRSPATPIRKDRKERKEDPDPSRQSIAEAVEACPESGLRIVERLCDLIVANGSKRPTPTARWYNDARLLVTRDGVDPEAALEVLEWCQADPFWRPNVLSMPKFRQRYDQLRLSMQRGGHPAGSAVTEEALVRHIDEARRRRA